jgi:hypothetical protein
MQKVKIFNIVICFCLPWLSVSVAAQNQQVIGQLIEQAKKQKQIELNSLNLVGDADKSLNNKKIKSLQISPPDVPELPVLWSLTGINNKLSAEILINEKIQKIAVVRGVEIASGWVVLAGDEKSLTLIQSKKTLTLFPVAMGSTGGEFQSLKKVRSTVTNTMGELQESLNNKGIPIEFVGPNIISQPVPRSNDSARQAASALPMRP